MNPIMTRRTVVPFLAAGALLALPAAASATDPEPAYQSGNPTCADLGFGHEIKFDPPTAGSLSADGVTVEMALGADEYGTLVDWTSSAPIDAVIVKGGPNANAYVYIGEASAGAGLHTPFNGPDKYYGLSHVNFCWDDQTPPPVDEPPVDQPPVDQPPVDQPPVDQPPVDQPPVDQPPVDQPPINTPPVNTPPLDTPPVVTPPADGEVLGQQIRAGASKLSGPSGCAGRTVKATVKGAEIASVVFKLDGRKVKTLAGAGSYAVKTSKLGVGVHKIRAKVTYTAASGTSARTHVVTFQRCAAKKIAPRFAG